MGAFVLTRRILEFYVLKDVKTDTSRVCILQAEGRSHRLIGLCNGHLFRENFPRHAQSSLGCVAESPGHSYLVCVTLVASP